MYRRLFSLSIIPAFIFCGPLFMAASQDEPVEPYKLGDEVEAFSLPDVDGNTHSIESALGEKVIIVYFWSCNCPVSRVYEERLQSLFNEYKDKEVLFCIVDSNRFNTIETIKKYIAKHKLPYPILKDEGAKLADRFGAEYTPECFVIGKDKSIRYHGAIDNNQNARKADQHYLKHAIDSLLAGVAPQVSEQKPFGCGIKR